MNILIIAEAGVNHDGDMDVARRLIGVAAESGADLVKFQTFVADRLTTADAVKAEYQVQTTDPSESQQEMLRRLELSRDNHLTLMEYSKEQGIGFFSTAFDIGSVDLLVSLGLDRLKVPSGELTNLPLLRHIGHQGLPTILSTGMGTLEEVGASIDVLETAGLSREQITVLHCNTEYPTPVCDVNLRAMITIREAFGVAVGYSDHTLGIEIPIAAAALGATTIEKHFTLDRQREGPDHAASLEPQELIAMVSGIRNIERALGDGIKRPSPSEIKNLDMARGSLVAALNIRSGEPFTVENLTVKRPGIGVSPMRWDEAIGCRASRDFARDEQIEL